MPGPCEYNPNLTNSFKRDARVLFGQSGKNNRRMITEVTPGPGSYYAENSQKYNEGEKDVSFAKAMRSTLADSKTPGRI